MWLAIDKGILWQPEVGQAVATEWTWGNMVLVFYFPQLNTLRKVKISTCFTALT